jgi:hypothetical protein
MQLVVRPYTRSDFDLLNSWLEQRGIFGVTDEMLGHLGFCVPDAAFAFLLLSNSPIAWIANWVVNPAATQEQRDSSISALLMKCESVAKDNGCIVIQSLAKFENMKNRFVNNDYNSFGEFTLYSKILGK